MVKVESDQQLKLVRVLLIGFMVGLLISGITAFPLTAEVHALVRSMGAEPGVHYSGLLGWLVRVDEALTVTDAQFPFLAYGTDWLAFAHVVIAALFIGPLRDPVRNLWVIRWGQFACLAVIPLALICGEIRGIPFYWRLIDCSFGVIGIIPLTVCARIISRMERSVSWR